VTLARLVRGPHVLPLAMFFGTFSWSFVYVSLPFHIQRISTWDAASTLRWTGWILGISPLATVAMAPLWGRLGFAPSFVLGGLVLFGCGALVHWGVPASAASAAPPPTQRSHHWRETTLVSLLVLGGSTQIFFLTAILPQVMTDLGIAAARTLEVGGVIIFASGAAAAVGSLAAPRLAELLPERRLVAGLLIGSSLAVGALAAAPGVWTYGALRFVQVLCIAPVFPIVVARVAHTLGGEAIGVINAARIGASFLGPVIATSLLASGSPVLLYVALSLIGLACVPLSAMRAHVPAVPR
jgi:MFS family permease